MDRILYWNVDTQHDFMDEDGKLYVEGAENLKPIFSQIMQFAKDNDISVVHTSDWHNWDSDELSDTPDFVNTFPNHCMAGTKGAYLIPETKPRKFDLIINWDQRLSGHTIDVLDRPFDIMLRKDKFDFIEGNKNSKRLLEILKDEFDVVYVFGVASEICVQFAIDGLISNDFKVKLIEEATKPLDKEKFNVMLKRLENNNNFEFISIENMKLT